MSCFRSDPDRLRDMFDRALSVDDITPKDQQEPQDEQDAPSDSDAETPEETSHLTDERREDKPPSRRPIYGTRRKENSPSWLLGPSKSTSRS
jgi:hypothetical protein